MLIEYSAKPMLEVRKDRIVQHARDREDARKRLVTLATKLGDAVYDLDMSAWDPLVVIMRISDEFRDVSSQRHDIGASLPDEIRLLLDFELGYCTALLNTSGFRYRESGKMNSSAPGVDEDVKVMLRLLSDRFAIPIDYLSPPAWNVPARRRLIRRAIEARAAQSARDHEQRGGE